MRQPLLAIPLGEFGPSLHRPHPRPRPLRHTLPIRARRRPGEIRRTLAGVQLAGLSHELPAAQIVRQVRVSQGFERSLRGVIALRPAAVDRPCKFGLGDLRAQHPRAPVKGGVAPAGPDAVTRLAQQGFGQVLGPFIDRSLPACLIGRDTFVLGLARVGLLLGRRRQDAFGGIGPRVSRSAARARSAALSSSAGARPSLGR